MNERVSVIQGKVPIVLVSPHGADDVNTALLTETAANALNCYAVINRGFERADKVDVIKDKANCNRVDHVKEDVVYEEFLRPILKIKDKLWKKWYKSPVDALNPNDTCCTIFYIHGCGDQVHREVGEQIGLIVGYGLGEKKNNLSCEEWRKNCFIECYKKYSIDKVYVGAGGGRYAGRDSNNMNQYFRKHYAEPTVDSMQLEFPFSTRNTEYRTKMTAFTLKEAIKDMLLYTRFDKRPISYFI